MPRKKYGTAWKNVAVGISESIRDPRVQPRSAPVNVPMKKLSTVEMPISPTVQGTAPFKMVVTGVDKVIETPRLPWNIWSR